MMAGKPLDHGMVIALRDFNRRAERSGAPLIHVVVALGLAIATIAVAASAARDLNTAQSLKTRVAAPVKTANAKLSRHADASGFSARRRNFRKGVYIVADSLQRVSTRVTQ